VPRVSFLPAFDAFTALRSRLFRQRFEWHGCFVKSFIERARCKIKARYGCPSSTLL
jgi:hypothetical protein